MAKTTLPDSTRKLILNAIDNVYENLRYKALGPFYQPKTGLYKPVSHDKVLSIPGMYSSAYATGKANAQPSFNGIQSVAALTDQYLQASAEKLKAKALAEVEAQLHNASHRDDYDLEKELNEALIRIFDQAQGETKQLLETETQRAKTIGITDSVTEFMKENDDANGNVYALTRQDKNVCKYCKEFYEMADGTPTVYKLSELGGGYLDKQAPEAITPPMHPNCLLTGESRVITKEGYKKIKHVNIGDYVLTHKMRFKKVTNTLNWYDTPYQKDFYNIKIKRQDQGGISVTPDHQVLTVDGFVPVSELAGRKIMKITRSCIMCNSSKDATYPGFFCSFGCRNEYFKNPIEHAFKTESNENFKIEEFQPYITHEKQSEPTYLYDLTVEDDHSFIANGIVSSNCRCLLLYLPPGYRLLPGGKVEYVSFDFDMYEDQRSMKKNLNPDFFKHDCADHRPWKT